MIKLYFIGIFFLSHWISDHWREARETVFTSPQPIRLVLIIQIRTIKGSEGVRARRLLPLTSRLFPALPPAVVWRL